jgi:hypothetical protein
MIPATWGIISAKTAIPDHENIGIYGVSMYSCADTDQNRFFGNGGTNQGVSGRKPHPRLCSNTFL